MLNKPFALHQPLCYQIELNKSFNVQRGKLGKLYDFSNKLRTYEIVNRHKLVSFFKLIFHIPCREQRIREINSNLLHASHK